MIIFEMDYLTRQCNPSSMGLCGPGSNGNESVFHNTQIFENVTSPSVAV